MQIVSSACLEIIKMRARLKKRNSRCRRRRRRAAFFPFRLLCICFQYKLRARCAEQRGKKKLHRANNAPAGAADIIYQIYELLMPQTNTGPLSLLHSSEVWADSAPRQTLYFWESKSYDLPPLSSAERGLVAETIFCSPALASIAGENYTLSSLLWRWWTIL